MAKKKRVGFRFGTKASRKKDDVRKPEILGEAQEVLTGVVQGQPASDIEERTHRALDVRRLSHDFIVYVETLYSLPFQKKQIDYMVYNGALVTPTEVDGYIGHYRTIGQQAEGWVRDLQINEALQPQGYQPIKHLPYWKLETQEKANQHIREVF